LGKRKEPFATLADRPATSEKPVPAGTGWQAKREADVRVGEPDKPTGVWHYAAAYRIAVALPFACVVAGVARYGFDAPYMDAWEFVPFLQKSYEGTLTLGDLWSQHNEHRIFVPRLIMLGLARLTHWDLRYELTVTVVCIALVFGVIAWQVRQTDRTLGLSPRNWALPVISLVIFSMNQWRMWLWSWQLQAALSLLAVMAAIVFLARPGFTTRYFIAAILCAFVATYSFASGLAVWLAGAVLLWLTREPPRARVWIRIGIWFGAGAIAAAGYLYHFEGGKQPFNVGEFYQHPVLLTQYIFAYLGAPVMNLDAGPAVALGVCGTALAVVLLVALRHRAIEWPALAPYVAMLAYVLACAAITSIGRSQYGYADATESRYIPFSNVLWVVNLVLLFLYVRAPRQTGAPETGRGRRLARGMIAAIAVLALLCCAHGAYRADERWDAFVPGRQALLEGRDDEMLLRLHPLTEVVLERREILVKYGLSVFADQGGLD
jgi:hypothetical protein